MKYVTFKGNPIVPNSPIIGKIKVHSSFLPKIEMSSKQFCTENNFSVLWIGAVRFLLSYRVSLSNVKRWPVRQQALLNDQTSDLKWKTPKGFIV